MAVSQEMLEHLSSGLTTLARCWVLTRSDGWVRGFTDHDADLAFAGITFKADTGLTANAIMQTTGLSMDNAEALGALSDASVTEEDIRAGRFDGADIEAWLVNWANTEERLLQFRGKLGDMTRSGGGFQAELLGLAEGLNQSAGRVFQTACTAVVGDARCGVDLSQPGLSLEASVASATDGVRFVLDTGSAFPERWFERGQFRVLDGAAKGLSGLIKNDRIIDSSRDVELWQEIRARLAPGDRVRISAGCNKHHKTCRVKFDNITNFRGFPSIPGEGRLMSRTVRGATVDQTGGGK